MTAVVELADFSVRLDIPPGPAMVVDGIDLSLQAGDRLALLGESGSGKSTLGYALIGLLPGAVMDTIGRLRFEGAEMGGATERDWQALRGRSVSMVFQDPSSSRNPVLRIGEQLREALHGQATPEAAAAHLGRFGFSDPRAAMRLYPHQMSGGMKQRAVIAMATALRPKLIIADELTTAPDPSLRRQVIDLLIARCRDDKSALLMITHDLVEARHAEDRIAVMYAGRIVEIGATPEVLRRPRHRYTEALLRSRPGRDFLAGDLPVIEGIPPRPGMLSAGCAFAPRCHAATDLCRAVVPPTVDIEGHRAAYHHPSQGAVS